MKKLFFTLLLLICAVASDYAQQGDSTAVNIAAIENSLKYQTGNIKMTGGNATLNVPKGFKFLDAKQTQHVLTDLWGNPEDLSVLGALVPEKKGVLADDSWLFTVTYDNMGFVKDDDAKDMDYDELLVDLKEDIKKENEQRAKDGLQTVSLIGWASKPYYDDNRKVLHWAKELHFSEQVGNTLNYDLRVLGRKGVFILSAVASMKELPEVKANMENVISSIKFDEGNQYADFDSGTDTIAAWTIGGLVAGKVLAKVGFFALILKFWKLLVLAVVGGFGAIKKFLFGKKDQVTTNPDKEDEEPTQQIAQE